MPSRWEEVKACPLCGVDRSQHRGFEQIREHDDCITFLFCSNCGLVFQSPRPSPEGLTNYYERRYHLEMMPDADDASRNEWVQEQRAEYLVEHVRGVRATVGRFLDVGSSRGQVLEGFRRSFECIAVGVEPGDQVRQSVQDKGFDVFPDLEEVPAGLWGKFDVVNLSHTLEHLPDPVPYLARLREAWMAAGAHLVVEVPNLIWHPSLEPAHLTAFTKSSLLQLLAVAGFECRKFLQHGLPYSRRLPLFLLAVAEPRDGPGDQPFKAPGIAWTKTKRAIGLGILKAAQAMNASLRGAKAMAPWRE